MVVGRFPAPFRFCCNCGPLQHPRSPCDLSFPIQKKSSRRTVPAFREALRAIGLLWFGKAGGGEFPMHAFSAALPTPNVLPIPLSETQACRTIFIAWM